MGNRRDFMDGLGAGGDGNMRNQVEVEWRGDYWKSQLEMGSFEGQLEIWCKGNSWESTRMIPAKTPSTGQCVELSVSCDQARLPVERSGHQPSHTTFDLKSVLTMECVEVRVVQRLWESMTGPTPRHMPGDRHCLECLYPEAGWPRDLE